jgi:hypothetical protein
VEERKEHEAQAHPATVVWILGKSFHVVVMVRDTNRQDLRTFKGFDEGDVTE